MTQNFEHYQSPLTQTCIVSSLRHGTVRLPRAWDPLRAAVVTDQHHLDTPASD